MNMSVVNGQLRILIPVAATWFAAKGILFDSTTWNVVLGAVITIAMSGWSGVANTDASMKSNVKEMPNTMVVETHTDAGAGDNQLMAANQIANLPNVSKVLATADVAHAAPSAKVTSQVTGGID